MTNRNFSSIVIELFIVIVGVSIAFWLNNIGEANKNNETKTAYYQELQSDIKRDLVYLESILKQNKGKTKNMEVALSFYNRVDPPIDSILPLVFQIGSYHFFMS